MCICRLGLGDTEDRATPTLVAALGLVPVTRVSTSGRFSFAVA
jgi:hypothetical protein